MEERTYDIAVASSRYSNRWHNKRVRWQQIVKKCSTPVRTGETLADYLRASKKRQDEIKDHGGFVGGYLGEGRRKKDKVRHRSLLTFDLDDGSSTLWEDFTRLYPFAAILYTTHKHTPEHPRYRLVIPLLRNVSPEEYEPLGRWVAGELGIEQFDHTTYQPSRLFYWPTVSKNGEFVFREQQGSPCDPDAILAHYTDWRDASSWPVSSKESVAIKKLVKKQGNPQEKSGLIGAFCRAYDIPSAIDTFLSDVYTPTGRDDRYTYAGGSASGGLVIYEHGLFAYSNHATDPASEKLCNAFDLVRIHKFGHEDEDYDGDNVTKAPSYRSMMRLAAADEQVRAVLNREQLQSALEDFSDGGDTGEPSDNESWLAKIERDEKTGRVRQTIENVVVVLSNCPGLKNHLRYDTFFRKYRVEGGLPWRKDATEWENMDDSDLRIFMEKFGLSGKDKIADGLQSVFSANRYNPVREYLTSLQWDGEPRLDRLIIDRIGAEDNAVNRAMTAAQFIGAVRRVMEPGCPHDWCLVLQGKENLGKTKMLKFLGEPWHSTINKMDGSKESMEQAHKGWLLEIGELESMYKSEVADVKRFLSEQEDTFRPAYGRVQETYKRQCVFFGTTNETRFLRGDTGNRRFWVIPCERSKSKYSSTYAALDTIIRDRDQIWAEAYHRYRAGESNMLPPEMEEEARRLQDAYNVEFADPRVSSVESYLDDVFPTDWEQWSLLARQRFFTDKDPIEKERTYQPEYVCAAQIQMELFGKTAGTLDRQLSRIINNTLERNGWLPAERRHFSLAGRQRGYRRPHNEDEDDL